MTNYYYIKETDTEISLVKTTDVLAIPDNVEIISEVEIPTYFPDYTATPHKTTKRRIIDLEYSNLAGKYITTSNTSRLTKYEPFKDSIISEFSDWNQSRIRSELCYFNNHNQIVQLNLKLQSSEVQYRLRDRVRSKLNIDRYESTDDEVVNHFQQNLNVCDADFVIESICNALTSYQNKQPNFFTSSAVAVKESIEAALSREHNDNNTGWIKVDIPTTSPNSRFSVFLNFDRAIGNFDQIKDMTINYINDVRKMSDHYRQDLPLSALKSIFHRFNVTTEELAKKITAPGTNFVFQQCAVIKPVDKTKKNRLEFLKLINQMKLYNTKAAIKSALSRLYSGYTEYNSNFSRYVEESSRYSSNIYFLNKFKKSIESELNTDALFEEKMKELIAEHFNKRQIRKRLFAAIRKELYVVKKTKK